MTLTYKKDGDIFTDQHEAIVCTTNCVGVMGKGIALEFKNRYPIFFKDYKDHCRWSNQRPGTCDIYLNMDAVKPKYLITFMTKDHWRNSSKIEWIDKGLNDLKEKIGVYGNIHSLGLPAPGCSNGGLDWKDVKPLIDKHLSDVNIDVAVYEPRG